MMGELQPIPWNVVRQDSGQVLVVGPEHYEFFSKVKHLTFLPTRCLWTRAPSKAYEGVECMVETGVVVIVRETELAAVALGITIVAAMLTLPGVSESRMSLASLNV